MRFWEIPLICIAISLSFLLFKSFIGVSVLRVTLESKTSCEWLGAKIIGPEANSQKEYLHLRTVSVFPTWDKQGDLSASGMPSQTEL